jgi:hypothetical protein
MKIKDLLFAFKWLLAAKSIGLEANNIYDKELESVTFVLKIERFDRLFTTI